MAFANPTDIVNYAIQLCGRHRVGSIDFDPSSESVEATAAYDLMREGELTRNLWVFATRREILRPTTIDSVIWTPATWSSGSNYSAGKVVAYAPTHGPYKGKTLYWDLQKVKAAATTVPDLDTDYHFYQGPTTINLYDSAETYEAGELVLMPPDYAGGTTYSTNDVVNSSGTFYVSLQDSNTGNAVSDTDYWIAWTSTGRANSSYGVTAAGSPLPLTYPTGYAIYRSLYNANVDNPDDGTANWLSVAGTVSPVSIPWPVGAGANDYRSQQYAYALPNGFLRRAPQNPRGGQSSYLGAHSGVAPDDYVLENGYLVTSGSGGLMLRFVANVIDVPLMHSLFCECLAARIASSLANTLLEPSRDRSLMMRRIDLVYARALRAAQGVNAVEVGPISPVENRYVLVRA